jgi:hypothetical protein
MLKGSEEQKPMDEIVASVVSLFVLIEILILFTRIFGPAAVGSRQKPK